MPYVHPAANILCGPAQSKCTWTYQKHFMRKFTGKMLDATDTTSIEHRATPTVRTPSARPRCLGKNLQPIPLWRRLKIKYIPMLDDEPPLFIIIHLTILMAQFVASPSPWRSTSCSAYRVICRWTTTSFKSLRWSLRGEDGTWGIFRMKMEKLFRALGKSSEKGHELCEQDLWRNIFRRG